MASTRPASHLADENVSSIQHGQPGEPIELQVNDTSIAINNDSDHPQGFSLPPADGGKAAWRFLVTCFFVEAFVWGFPFSYGIFEDYYSTYEPFAGKSGVPAVGTSAMGIMYMGSPFVFMMLQRWPNFRRRSCVLGLALISVALVVSSFSQDVWELILTQGVMYAIGGVLIYNPVLLFLDEWFVRRKGMAFGIMWAGTGASGVAIPFLMSWGLSRFAFRTILRAWGIAVALCLGPMLLFIKPRLPVTLSSGDARRRSFDYRFVLSPAFLALQAGNIFQGLGYFIPGIYLPSYAHGLGMSDAVSTATIALLNTTGVFGCIFVGVLIDRLHVTTVLLILALGSVISVFVLWGMSANVPLLLTFSAVYGFFAGPFTTTYTGVVREVRKQVPNAETGLVIGLLSAGRGIGSVVSGPLSQALLSGSRSKAIINVGYDTGYWSVITFTGVSVALGSFGFGARRLGWL